MMARRGVMALLAVGAAAAGLWRCSSYNALRYRMTVEVDTPEGVKSGFSVREMGLSTDNIMRPASGSLKGEAVAVDLPGGQVLFALLTGGDGDADYAMQIGGRAGVWEHDGPVELYPTAPKTTGLERTDPLPMLVRFRDHNDPKSVERIGPEALDRAFVPGVRLKRIAIEATDESVTTGIGDRLGWLSASSVMDNPGWALLPLESRKAINGLFFGTIGERK